MPSIGCENPVKSGIPPWHTIALNRNGSVTLSRVSTCFIPNLSHMACCAGFRNQNLLNGKWVGSFAHQRVYIQEVSLCSHRIGFHGKRVV